MTDIAINALQRALQAQEANEGTLVVLLEQDEAKRAQLWAEWSAADTRYRQTRESQGRTQKNIKRLKQAITDLGG